MGFKFSNSSSYALLVSFDAPRTIDLEQDGWKTDFMDQMYNLAASSGFRFPYLDSYEGTARCAMPRQEAMAFIAFRSWNFRIYVGDDDELFSLQFKKPTAPPVQPNHTPTDIKVKGGYATNIRPTLHMACAFKLFCGNDIYDLVSLECEEGRVKKFTPKI